ncbi:hypothetical protein HCN44_008309 [Aphidius gifuensis]|uniref:Zinc transporter ZIP11 n=1 Tax=Aphidius gifuensis TaxID=684658 RepID=A0A834XQE8_APHGI|nr:zinc transporter ZIP11 [Aphidius gifuensis]KAF7989635.1 hypothetical protein HCN44_008309 [Aphidius gifuensis]
MIKGYPPMVQALLGTLFTWGMTAAGSGLVVVIKGKQRKLLDASLGFAAGVMLAASYWSLLAPAIEMAEKSKNYGVNGEFAFIPVAIGFIIGAAFVYATDLLITSFGIQSPNMQLAMQSSMTNKKFKNHDNYGVNNTYQYDNLQISKSYLYESTTIDGFDSRNARRRQTELPLSKDTEITDIINSGSEAKKKQWRRVLLLVVAITVHNIPEGLAVGVGFGAIGSSASATFENARNLAIGIGIQNFPEGLAVSLPLQAAGFSTFKSFWYGQLSGMVEPIAGVLGAAGVSIAAPILPYALAFAAGAMIYVVIDDIIPEANQSSNGKLASWGAMVGFLVMMILDVGLG